MFKTITRINFILIFLFFIISEVSVKAQLLTISFDNPSASPTVCSTAFTEDGITQQLIPYSGNCSFSYSTSNNGELWLFPASLILDLSTMSNIDKIEIDQFDFCGPACTTATLNNNGTAVLSTSNANTSIPEMLVINNPSQLASDELVISSGESLIYEIRIFVAQNICYNVPVPVIQGLPFFTFTSTNTYTLSGTPVGGVFSGPGIVGNTFSPALAGLGLHFISYTYTDANGCSATETRRVRVLRFRQPLIFNPLKTANPKNEIALEIEASEAGQFTIELFDLAGRPIHRQTSNFAKGIHQTRIQLTKEPTDGVYLISISNGEERKTQKLKL